MTKVDVNLDPGLGQVRRIWRYQL